jgi:type IV pilus assembly protein PilA
MRLFFALWPPAETARTLSEWSRAAQRVAGGKPTAQDKIHLTLAFLGAADAQKAAAAAERVAAEPHVLPIEQARYWRDNQIVWAGPRETPAPLTALVERLTLELYREEFVLERRAFAAHVTLLRKARAAELPPLPALEWPVREFSLVRSSLSSAGSSYEVLKRFPLGFTLVEVMVVLGIVAVLALMLLPSYHQRSIREQVLEALPLAEIAQKPIAAAWAVAGALPADNAAAALPPAEKIVSNLVGSMAVEAGAIHLKFGNRAFSQIKGKVLTLRPAVVEDAQVVPVAWVCGYASVPEKMAVKGTNRTDVPKDYLPARCR